MKKNLLKNLSETQLSWAIFFAFFIVRFGFALFSGYDNFALHGDAPRYLEQSDMVLRGDFNFQTTFFIGAPFYPIFQALFKFIFGSYWIAAHQFALVVLMSLSGVTLYKMTNILFDKKNIALIAAFVYCFFPMTFWWTHTFSQDSPFQFELIFTMYFLFKGVKNEDFKSIIYSAILFSITFLTKSHALFFSPFIVLYIYLNSKSSIKTKLTWCAVYAIISFAFTIPYGLYQLKTSGTYVLSSNGLGGHFISGHNDDMYKGLISPPPLNSEEERRYKAMDFQIIRDLKDTLQTLNPKQKQDLFLAEGIKWCKNNSEKMPRLLWTNFYRSMMPGVNKDSYPFKFWLLSFLISLPIYLFAYLTIPYLLAKEFKQNIWIIGLYLSVFILSVIFYVQNRFRTITLEPFYIIYASYGFYNFVLYIKNRLKKGAGAQV